MIIKIWESHATRKVKSENNNDVHNWKVQSDKVFEDFKLQTVVYRRPQFFNP